MNIKEKLNSWIEAIKKELKDNQVDAKIEVVDGKVWIEYQAIGLAD